MDAGKLVELAKCWKKSVPEATVSATHSPRDLDLLVEPNATETSTLQIQSGAKITTLEHVQVRFSALMRRRGDLALVLISPCQTRSKIIMGEPITYKVNRVTLIIDVRITLSLIHI